jgi:hypothetical protein
LQNQQQEPQTHATQSINQKQPSPTTANTTGYQQQDCSIMAFPPPVIMLVASPPLNTTTIIASPAPPLASVASPTAPRGPYFNKVPADDEDATISDSMSGLSVDYYEDGGTIIF